MIVSIVEQIIRANYSSKLFEQIIRTNYSSKLFEQIIRANYLNKLFEQIIRANYSSSELLLDLEERDCDIATRFALLCNAKYK